MTTDHDKQWKMTFPDRVYKRLVIVNTVMLFVIILGGCLLLSLRRERVAEILRSWVDRSTATSRAVDAINTASTSESLDYPVYDLKIDSQEMRQIELQSRRLVETGLMSDDLVQWFPARFFHNEQEFKTKVRLRGDLGAHWADEKKSWRVKFKKDQMFDGRRVVDFIVPHDKAFEIEKVTYDVARKLGLLVPDAGFANLRINGVDFGAYFWMERYGPEMLEKQGYVVGEIFHDQDSWKQTKFNGLGIRADGFTSSSTTIVNDADRLSPYAARWDKLNSLTREVSDEAFAKEIPHLVDIDKFVKWNAITWVFGSLHSHVPSNLRWYYDSTSGLFEPILYDVFRYPLRLPAAVATDIPKWKFESHETLPLARRILQIPTYRQLRNRVLWELVTEPEFDVSRMSKDYFEQLRRYLLSGVGSWDSSELDKFHQQTIEILDDNRNSLREQLSFARLFLTTTVSNGESRPTFVTAESPDNGTASDTVHAARRTSNENELHESIIRVRILPDCRNFIGIEKLILTLEAGVISQVDTAAVKVALTDPEGRKRNVKPVNVSSIAGERLQIELNDVEIWTPVDSSLTQYPAEWILDIELGQISADTSQQLSNSHGNFLAAIDVEGKNVVTGQTIAQDFKIRSPLISGIDPHKPLPASRDINEFLDSSDLPWQFDGNRLTLPQGNHTVDGTVTIPAGCEVHFAAGTTLDMAPGANVICYSPLIVNGTADQPVRIKAADETNPWGTLAVVRAGDISRINHLDLSGGSESHLQGLFLSGQLCFYWSDVEINDSLLHDARADDACNVKNAQLSINRCLFYDNSGDGLDADFCQGHVASSRFERNRGDGVDVSGSQLLVRDCLFEQMQDKGISVGEKSELLAFNNLVRNCAIGLASKDLSQATIYASVLYENETGLALYRKKEIFGGGHSNAIGVLFWKNGQQVDLDEESQLEIQECAADRWDTDEANSQSDVSLGNVDDFYKIDPRLGAVSHDDIPPDSPFIVTRSTAGAKLGEFSVPDLQGKPVGLFRPSSLPARPND